MVESKKLKCPGCGSNIPCGSRSCTYCGSPLLLAEGRTRFVLARMSCPHCGIYNTTGLQYCQDCGSPLFKNCPSCNEKIEISAVYCTKCGEACEKSSEEQLQLQLENLEANRSYIIAHSINPLKTKLERAREKRKWYAPVVAISLGIGFLSALLGGIGFDLAKISFVVSLALLVWIGVDLLKTTPRMRKKLVELDKRVASLDRQITDYSDELTKNKGHCV